MNISLGGLIDKVQDSELSQMVFTGWQDRHFFLKDFLAGMFIAIVMTGLDQDMMQKNLSCRNVKEAKKNIYWLGTALVPVNLIFLFLGAVLFIYAADAGLAIPERTDDLFPTIALKYLGPFAGIVFITGLISAAYSSADSALTALTTSFTIDILGIRRSGLSDERKSKRIRYIVHIGVSLLVLLVIIIFRAIHDESVISKLFTIAGYTYGPLLGLFAFGFFTKYEVKDKWVPVVALISPLICYILSVYDQVLLNGYNFGFELLILNGIFTFLGLMLIKKK